MDIGKVPKFNFKILERPDVPVRVIAAGSDIVVNGTSGKEMFLLRKGRAQTHRNGEVSCRTRS